MLQLERLAQAVTKAIQAELLPLLAELAAEQRADADDKPVPIRVLHGLDRLKVKVRQATGGFPAASVVAQAAGKVEVTNASSIGQVAKDLGLSVQPLKGSAKLQAARSRFLAENTALITNIPEQMRERVEGKVRAGVESGKRWETIAKELQEEGDIGERRARLIARDQVNKYNGALTEARQTGLGITHYRWSGAMDARERPEHVALQGMVFAWDKPPPGGNPGFPIQCRCVAIPVVSEKEKRSAVELTPEQLAAKTAAVTAEKGGRAKKVGPAKVAPVAGKAGLRSSKPETRPTSQPKAKHSEHVTKPAGVDIQDQDLATQLQQITTTKGQSIARDSIRSILESHGCDTFDQDLPGAGSLETASVNSWRDGAMTLTPKSKGQAVAWLQKGSMRHADAVVDLYHEGLHGAGLTLHDADILAHGAVLEVVNELAAVELFLERYGVDFSIVSGGIAYEVYVNEAVNALAKSIGLDVPSAAGLLRKASLNMKRPIAMGFGKPGPVSIDQFMGHLKTSLAVSGKLSAGQAAAGARAIRAAVAKPI